MKASAGAVEHLRLAPVDDLAGALADLHARGLRIVGADGDAPLTAREADLRGPIAIVVGSEGRGLGPAVRRRCDLLVRIPMHGRIESLNAAVAGSILLYEAAAQRRLAEAPRRTRRSGRATGRRRDRRRGRRDPGDPRRCAPSRTRAAATGAPAPGPRRTEPAATDARRAMPPDAAPSPAAEPGRPRPTRRRAPARRRPALPSRRRPPRTPSATPRSAPRGLTHPRGGTYHSPARGVLLLFDYARVPT